MNTRLLKFSCRLLLKFRLPLTHAALIAVSGWVFWPESGALPLAVVLGLLLRGDRVASF